MTNSSTSSATESTQVRKTVSFSKKRDKDLIGLDELQDDFSYNAKQLMRDGLKFRQLIQSQQLNVNEISVVSLMDNNQNVEIEEENDVKNLEVEEIVKDTKPTNFQDFLNSKTKEAEITDDDKERLEKNLDF